MTRLATQIADAGHADRILTERQLTRIVKGSDASRYGLVNRALKDGSLIRLKRSLYVLSPQWRSSNVHPFAVAQAIMPGSYVSLETALSHHGWIPEAVHQTANITPGRKSFSVDHDLYGRFTFHPLALNSFEFLRSVERIVLGKQTTLVASPLRALFDLIAYRKEEWRGLDELTDSLRLDAVQLGKVKQKDVAALKPIYKQKRVNECISAFAEAVLKSSPRRRTTAR